VIHRDLKPHNVIVGEGGHVKVTDFGIARAGASDMTETGSIMGTAQYLSPEQAQGHAVSASSDLYAIAVVLYEMLTGRVPFDADAAVTIALKHVAEAPTAPTRINAMIPPALEQVVMWGLNKNPIDRPKDADEFIAALESARASIVGGAEGERTASMAAVGVPAGGGAPVTRDAQGFVPEGPPPLVPLPVAPPPAPPPEYRRRRNPWPWVAVLVALLVAGGAVAAYLLTRPVKVTVPNVIGEQISTATTRLNNAGFTVSPVQVTSSQQSGTVIYQSPLGGTRADKGSTVSLHVSSGPGTTTVPGVIGDPLAQAKSAIRAARLQLGRVIRQSSSQFAVGQVINQDPTGGSTPLVGTKVDLFISTGPPKVSVPDVTGETEGQAKSTLQSHDFSVHVTPQTTSTAPAGTVIDQSPNAGTSEPQGSTVTIVVAKAPPAVKIPDVRGEKASTASNKLKQAGFNVTQQPKNVTNKSQNGIVLSESPSQGTNAKKGSTVTITVGHYAAAPPPTRTTPTTTSTIPIPGP
jgi:serine/threonine-protein kinase